MDAKSATPLERCPKCKRGTLKQSSFRTGSVEKPKADVRVCDKCGHVVEKPTDQPAQS